jgi:hypothetical protein
MKLVYNACFGGFSLSHAGIMRYAEIKGIKLYPYTVDYSKPAGEDVIPLSPAEAATEKLGFVHYTTFPEHYEDNYWSDRDIARNDPALVQVVEELGDAANGSCAKLRVCDLPKGTIYRIDEYDGRESVVPQDGYQWEVAT